MKRATLCMAFIALVDAAPLIVAQEMGFAGEEGISLDLRRAPSWPSLRDMLCFGQADAAHMIWTLPVATTMGLGGASRPLAAVSVLSINGNMIGVSCTRKDLLPRTRSAFDFADARVAGLALRQTAGGPLRIGAPFPFSMHAELEYSCLAAVDQGTKQQARILTLPLFRMTEAIEAGEIDAFCVGEPWDRAASEKALARFCCPVSRSGASCRKRCWPCGATGRRRNARCSTV